VFADSICELLPVPIPFPVPSPLPEPPRSSPPDFASPFPGAFEVVCTSGAKGKCVRFGYKPWEQIADGSRVAMLSPEAARTALERSIEQMDPRTTDGHFDLSGRRRSGSAARSSWSWERPSRTSRLNNVHRRLESSFGPGYGLGIDTAPGEGTEVRLTVPKSHPGVRAA
jgi:hypothetical protein